MDSCANRKLICSQETENDDDDDDNNDNVVDDDDGKDTGHRVDRPMIDSNGKLKYMASVTILSSPSPERSLVVV